MIKLRVSELRERAQELRVGETVLLSGTVYTARDAAHKRIVGMINNGESLPFELKNACIYYAGPTPTVPNAVCGSFGPTTACRMDSFAPLLYDMGVVATIGKGARNKNVVNAVKNNKGLYLLAIGGAGAEAAGHITSLEEIAFLELGCESVKKLEFCDFPLIVGIDSEGNDIFSAGNS